MWKNHHSFLLLEAELLLVVQPLLRDHEFQVVFAWLWDRRNRLTVDPDQSKWPIEAEWRARKRQGATARIEPPEKINIEMKIEALKRDWKIILVLDCVQYKGITSLESFWCHSTFPREFCTKINKKGNFLLIILWPQMLFNGILKVQIGFI